MFTDITEDSLAPPYDSPVELKDVHKKESQDQERGLQPTLEPNPSYEPLEVCMRALEVKDAHKNNNRIPGTEIPDSALNMQPNPSYEPLEVCENAVKVNDAHKKNCVPEEQETSVDTKMQPNPSYEPLKVYEPNYL